MLWLLVGSGAQVMMIASDGVFGLLDGIDNKTAGVFVGE
ncbi:hypothetical protein SAMN04489751_1403 [Brevibacterium sandarakinum]|uniref:Uncharacterized protein n=1 Tax=Brevibacterium sandarakinum TaxID=629680 RepID=A0A1H1Q1V0_BRESA|nr:hypothetical protein SAMN04489751_1403 [Brevibacterium sandarakinum]